MNELRRPTFAEARRMLSITNPELLSTDPDRPLYKMSPEWAGRIYAKLQDGTPIYDIDRYSEFLDGLQHTDLDAVPPGDEGLAWTFTTIGALAACSIESTILQASDTGMDPPRLETLAEHNQDVINTRLAYGKRFRTDPRDSLAIVVDTQQDGGKSLAVALTGSRHTQSTYNPLVAQNVWQHVPPDILSRDAKLVGELLIREGFIGMAINQYVHLGVPLETAVEPARAGLDKLRFQCPGDYRDRFDVYLLSSFMIDSAAHREEAWHIDADTGLAERAVDETVDATLSYLYDSTVTDRLRFQPGPMRVVRALFPDLADYYE